MNHHLDMFQHCFQSTALSDVLCEVVALAAPFRFTNEDVLINLYRAEQTSQKNEKVLENKAYCNHLIYAGLCNEPPIYTCGVAIQLHVYIYYDIETTLINTYNII